MKAKWLYKLSFLRDVLEIFIQTYKFQEEILIDDSHQACARPRAKITSRALTTRRRALTTFKTMIVDSSVDIEGRKTPDSIDKTNGRRCNNNNNDDHNNNNNICNSKVDDHNRNNSSEVHRVRPTSYTSPGSNPIQSVKTCNLVNEQDVKISL